MKTTSPAASAFSLSHLPESTMGSTRQTGLPELMESRALSQNGSLSPPISATPAGASNVRHRPTVELLRHRGAGTSSLKSASSMEMAVFAEAAGISPGDMSREFEGGARDLEGLDSNAVAVDIERLMIAMNAHPEPSAALASSAPPGASDIGNPVPGIAENVAAHLRAKYFNAISGFNANDTNDTNDTNDPQQTQLIEERIAQAARALESVGCATDQHVEGLLRKIRIHDTLARLLGGSIAGGAGYASGIMIFTERIAAILGPDVSPAKSGLYAGLFVGMLDSVMAPMAGAVTENHLVGSSGQTAIDAIDSIKPSLLKAALVPAVSNAAYSIVKNSSRIIAPWLVPAPLQRTPIAKLDRVLDVGGIFCSAPLAKEHARRILRGSEPFATAKFLAQPDLQERLQKFSQPFTMRSTGKALAEDLKAMGSAASKAVCAPSSYLITLYIGAMISALLHSKSQVTALRASSGLPADEISRAEAAELGAVSTGIMAALGLGATIIGVTSAATLDGHVRRLWETGAAAVVDRVRKRWPAPTVQSG